MLYLRINIPILYIMTCCARPNIKKLNEDYDVCINCLFSIPIIDKKSDECCINPNITSEGVCLNCSTIHQIFTNKLDYHENDSYQTNVLYKIKKVHNPYKYFKKIILKLKIKKYMILF